MQNLRGTDGTPVHRKGMRHHMAKCRGGGAPLHATLLAEGTALYDDLKAKERVRIDADDDLADASAVADTAEVAFENTIRDLDADLVRFDRENPGKDARHAIFSDGFGAVIEPEGERQLEVLPALHVKIEPFQNEPALVPSFAKLNAVEATLKAALAAEDAASEAADTAFAQEVAARAAIRAQLTSAHGRLRDLYKSRPAQAEAFFLKIGRKEGKSPPGGGEGGEGGGTP